MDQANRQSGNKRTPPYGRSLIQLLQANDTAILDIWVFCGADAWARAQHSLKISNRGTLLMPVGEPPEHFNWGVVNGLDVLVVHTGGLGAGALQNLAVALVRAGATMAVCIGESPAWDLPIVKPKRVQ